MTAVGEETKIGSGVNFVDVRRRSTGPLEDEEADGGVKSAIISAEDTRSSCFPIARFRPFEQQRCFGVREGPRLFFSIRCLRWSVMSVRTGPASNGRVAIQIDGGISAESEDDTGEVDLHISLSRHSQGLRRDMTMKSRIQDHAERRNNTRTTSK